MAACALAQQSTNITRTNNSPGLFAQSKFWLRDLKQSGRLKNSAIGNQASHHVLYFSGSLKSQETET